MTLDAYQVCPGGMNKKIKFCECGKDLLPDLNKVIDAVSAGQRAAALSQLSRLSDSHGPRACLLAIRSSIELEMGNLEGLAATTRTFLEHFPQNSIALAYGALVATSESDLELAVDRLQGSLEAVEEVLHDASYAAIGIVGRVLAQAGEFLPALGHLTLQAAIAPQGDNTAWDSLRFLYASQEVSLLMKQPIRPLPPPSGAPWAERFQQAVAAGDRGCWRRAARLLVELDQEFPGQTAILQRLALYQSWLGERDLAADALHRLAAVDNLDRDTAVETEALAQLLSDHEEATVDEVAHTYPITDTERVLERLLSERHVVRMTADLSALGGEASPPPRGGFWLLDRAAPASGHDLQLHEVPNVLGEMYLYGRETDRQARVEFVTLKGGDYEAKRDSVERLLAGFGGTVEKEEPVGQVAAEAAALTWRWRLPEDTPPEKRTALIDQKRQDVNLNVWPETPLATLDGKRPTEVAGDPAYQVRLLAAILLMELIGERTRSGFDFNTLRAKLGLPLREAIDPSRAEIEYLPAVRLHLLPPEKLSDQQLASAFEQAVMLAASRAVRGLGAEVLRRPALVKPAERARIIGTVASFAENLAEAVEFNQQAQAAAQAAGQSLAPWLLAELELRLMSGDEKRSGELFKLLQTRYIKEPGVGQALHALLVRIGVITPDGQFREGGRQRSPQAPPEAGPAAAAPAGLWTPGSSPPPPAGEKPKIWMPGMD